MKAKSLSVPRYADARERGNVTHQDGYHQPGSGPRGRPRCGCSLDTEKGAYRDVTVEMPDGATVHFYHQSPVVVTEGDTYRLDSHGYRTSTTKERINRYLPSGYKVVQDDFDWYLKTWNPAADFEEREYDRRPFEDGMTIEV